MSKAQQEALMDYIKSSQCIEDLNLVSWVGIIPLLELKYFLVQQVRKFTESDTRKAYFNALSLNDILSTDLITHVLSFNHFPHNGAINQTDKMWNKCSRQVTVSQNKERQQIMDDYDMNYNEKVNNVWIVDLNRKELSKEETSAGYRGPISDLVTALELCESGDKLLVNEGEYCKTVKTPTRIDKSIQIIGIGNVIFQHKSQPPSFLIFGAGSISYVEN
eukprot:353206_1